MSSALPIVGILVMAVVAVLIKPRHRLLVAAALAVPQIYLSVLPASLFQVWMLVVLVLSLVEGRRRGSLRSIEVPLALLAIVTLLYALISPNPGTAVLLCAQLLAFLAALRLLYAPGVSPVDWRRAAGLLATGIVAQAALVIVFRLSPAMESAFLQGELGRILIGPSASALFTTDPNNVLDPDKAGGLFVNGNVASMFLGVAAFLCVAVALRFSLRWPWWVAALSMVGVIATGSKTGLLLALLLPVATVALLGVTGRWGPLAGALLLPLVAVVGIAAPPFLASRFPALFADLGGAVDQREPLWEAARQVIADNAVFGLGFGGWSEYAIAAVGRAMPPHNLIFAAWIDTGMMGVVLVVVLLASMTVLGVRAVAAASTVRVRASAACAMVAVWWVAIHGMGDNTTIYGEMRTLMLVALALALLADVLDAREPGALAVRRRPESASRARARALSR